ncbi:transferrin-binding protein-like solute binding protein [Conchiformibius steedae]|uniref:Transferrin-binding protein B C-lobe/N-lobe beta-barrel domain-containing protein n=1 Tax=Conchiformibius steedae TaxID=153493 RepID=A0A3P2A6D3_9NEIS|nr:transferrin-binding protein-like solute binding protein [Conchiformibius steedae]RRD90545.1 hypothetical protein EII21_04500 [Conchiformibius steedae]
MKSNLFKMGVKMGVSTFTALILSACGSSGGDDAPSTKSQTTPNNGASTSTTPSKEDYALKAANALKEAQAAKAEAEKAAAAGDVAAAQAAVNKAQAAAQAAQEAAVKAGNDKDPNAPAAALSAQQAVEALKTLATTVADAQKVAEQKLAQDNANKSISVSTVPVNNKASNVGYKHVIKTKSDFILNGVKKSANSESNTGLLMQEQDPNKHLDNFVIGHYRDNNGKENVLYLQDVDSRSAAEVPKFGEGSNKVDFSKVWVADVSAKGKDAYRANLGHEGNRTLGKHLVDVTKISREGTAPAKGLVYQKDRKIYIHGGVNAAGKNNSGFKANEKVNVLTFDERGNPKTEDIKQFSDENFGGVDPSETVLEVYGNKFTFSKTEGGNPVKYAEEDAKEYKNGKNLPLENTTLHHVQYGRVTSQLSGRHLDDFVEGLHQNHPTYIVAFGKYGADGTENHYFARGVNNTTADQLAALPAHYGTNKLTYQGHVVPYGLDHSFRQGQNNGKVPTALGGSAKEYLISGTHIRANVDLATKLVDGNVYNVWGLVKNNDFDTLTKVEAPLVGFNGTLADNGNIAGTAQNYTKDYAPGVFNATIFGAKGEEMGGTIVSANPEKLQWGLSFGAKNTTTPPAVKPLAPPPVKPIGGGVTGVLDGSDQQGLTNLVK